MTASLTEKRCPSCGETKPRTGFHRDKSKSSGFCSHCKSCVKTYQAAIMPQILKSGQRWREANPEKVRRTKEANREAYSATGARWQRDNPDKHCHKQAARRARVRGADGSHTLQEWQGLCEAHGHRCVHCGRDDSPLTRDHIVPVSKGGSDFIANIQPLCRVCNCRKGAKL